jgi:hypothetical protein
MQDNIKNTNQPDAFSESVRRKLENHTLPIDPGGWNDLQARMNAPKRKKIIPFWYWFSGGAAVAVLAMLFIFQPFSEQKDVVSKMDQPKGANQNEVVLSTDTNVLVAENKNKSVVQSEKVIPHSKRVVILQTEIAIPDEKPKDVTAELFSNSLDKKENINGNMTDNRDNPTETANIDEKKSVADSALPTKRVLPDNLIDELVAEEPIAKKKAKEEWMLAAAFGSGGSTSLSGASDFLSAESGVRSLSKAETNYTKIMSPDDFSNKTFMAPLSFGLVIRKNIGNNLALESGLVYTYLLSTFEERNSSHFDARLSLHYLGIPLNLVVPVWKNSKLEVYLSGGGMVEKGLRSIYIQNQYFVSQVITTDARTNIDGFQWSANAAIGVTYKIQRNVSLYFEPKFSYFFENDQPVSARTDQPVVVGLTGGLRFNF